jgi:nucleoside-diphosphate kinase
VVAFVLEGTNAVVAVRKTIGVTRSFEAEPGTIRGDFALEVGRNLVHASDGLETAKREVALWFTDAELSSWSRDTDRWIFE